MKKLQLTILALVFLPLFSFTQDYWEEISFPESTTIYCIAVNQEGDYFVGAGNGGNPGGLYRSTDMGETWELLFDAGNFVVNYVAFDEEGNIYIAKTGFHIFQRSTDNGETWEEIMLPANNTVGRILPIGLDTIYISMSGGNGVSLLLRSVDNATSWDSIFYSYGAYISDIIISGNGIINLSLRSPYPNTGGVYRSEDNGTTWDFKGLFNHMVSSLALNDSGDLFAGSWGGFDLSYAGFYVLRNGEDDWDTLMKGPQVTDVVINSENGIYFSSYWPDGVIRSLDNGETFELINEGLPPGPMGYLTIDDFGFLFVTSSYLSNFLAKTKNTTVTVQEYDIDTDVNSIVLHPNPVKDYITLNSLRTDKQIFLKQLSIYNTSGVLITFQDVNLPIKNYQIYLGFLVPGIYFMKIETEDNNYVFKIIKY